MGGPRLASGRLGAVALALVLLLPGCVEQLRGAVYEPQEEPVKSAAADMKRANVTNASRKLLNATIEGLYVPAPDGVRLRVDVFRPNTTDPVPVVLVQSPYFHGVKVPEAKNIPDRNSGYARWLGMFLSHGMAVALADLRGTAQSDGCVDLGGPKEQADAVAVVEFLGTQQWSNGKVGMIGGSYDGWTQLMAAANGAPHLAAIVPIAPVADWYHVVGKGGAKYAGWTPHSPLGYNFLIPMGDPATLADPERAPADPRLQRADDQACAAENQLWSDDLSGDYNDWMKARDLRPKAAQAKAPMLYAHGLVDMNARPDHVDPWYNSYGGPKRAWLWQMTHASPSAANTGRGTDWDALVLAWMDHHLLGLDNGINRTYGTVEVQDSIGRWRVETAWPPLDAAPTELPLSRGRLALPGQANATPAAAGPLGALPDVPASALLAEETATWQDTVVEDGGTLGTRTTAPGRGDAPGRLCFRSDPLPTDLHYAGRPVARVVVSSDRPQTLVVARLYQILPDGSWVLVNEGVRALAARDSLEEPQPGTPQTTYTLHVEMQPEDFVFRAGDAIGLVLSSSDASYVVPSGTLATNALHMGGPTPSALVLPAIERANFTAVTWGDEQPPWEGPEPWGVPR